MTEFNLYEFKRVSMSIAKDFGAEISPEVKATFKSLTSKEEVIKYRDSLINKALENYSKN